MKKLISAFIFTSLSISGAMAQTNTIYTKPTKRPANVKTPPGVTMSALEVEGVCGTKVSIKITLNYDQAAESSVILWGNFPQTTVTVPAGKSSKTYTIQGSDFVCSAKDPTSGFGVLHTYAALGDTQAMQTQTFSTQGLGVFSNFTPISPIPNDQKTPAGVKLVRTEVVGVCGAMPVVNVTLSYPSPLPTAKAYVSSSALLGFKSDFVPLPSASGEKTYSLTTVATSTFKKLECEGPNVNLKIGLQSRTLLGHTVRIDTVTDNDGNIVGKIKGIGASATLIP